MSEERTGYRRVSLEWLARASRLPLAARALALVVLGLRYADTEQGWRDGSYSHVRSITGAKCGNTHIRDQLEVIRREGLIEFSTTPRLSIRLVDPWLEPGHEMTRPGHLMTRPGHVVTHGTEAPTGSPHDSTGSPHDSHRVMRGLAPGHHMTPSEDPDDPTEYRSGPEHVSQTATEEMTPEQAQAHLEAIRADYRSRLSLPRPISEEEDIW